MVYGVDMLKLQHLAIQILSQGCSASPCERLWSSFGHIVTKKRNRLGSVKANDLVFVNANLRLLRDIGKTLPDTKFIGLSQPETLPPHQHEQVRDGSSASSLHENLEDDEDFGDDVAFGSGI